MTEKLYLTPHSSMIRRFILLFLPVVFIIMPVVVYQPPLKASPKKRTAYFQFWVRSDGIYLLTGFNLYNNQHIAVSWLTSTKDNIRNHIPTQWKLIHNTCVVPVIKYHSTWLSDSGSMMVGAMLPVSATCPLGRADVRRKNTPHLHKVVSQSLTETVTGVMF